MRLVLVLCNLLFFICCNSQHGITAEQQEYIDKIKENFVFVEGGTFEMGKNGLPEANPRHSVIL